MASVSALERAGATSEIGTIGLRDWTCAVDDPQERTKREGFSLVLRQLWTHPLLGRVLHLHGGLLMSLCYGSPRLTGDLDFLTPADLGKITDAFRNDICALNKQGRFVLELVEVLGVGPGFKVLRLICRARSFPGEAAHASLPDTVMLELGQVFHLFRPRLMRDPEEPYPILTNGMHNFMADKITSFLLQEKVGKSRGQDVFDACYMLDRVRFGERDLMMIYHNLSTNLATQEAAPTIAGFDEAILYNRAKESYDRLAFQPGFVPPPFDQLFGKMRNFFRSLPWEHMG